VKRVAIRKGQDEGTKECPFPNSWGSVRNGLAFLDKQVFLNIPKNIFAENTGGGFLKNHIKRFFVKLCGLTKKCFAPDFPSFVRRG